MYIHSFPLFQKTARNSVPKFSRRSSYQFHGIQRINHVTRIGQPRENYLKCRAAAEAIRVPEGLSAASLSAANNSGTCL